MAMPFSLIPDWTALCTPRLGMAKIVRLSTEGENLTALWGALVDDTDDTTMPGRGMDLSVLAQLKGDQALGLKIQDDMLRSQRLYSIHRAPGLTGLRVLALAAASDIGSNTPIDFLLEGSDVQLAICYVLPGMPFPEHLPDHDVAIVIAPTTRDGEFALDAIEAVAPNWPKPLINRPAGIRKLERDALYATLDGIPGLVIPRTEKHARAYLESIGDGANLQIEYPIIIRPLGSHAGVGLEKIDSEIELRSYVQRRSEQEFFISSYVDYSGNDGLFRKCRVAIIGGRGFAVHMGISDEWKVWYASADMAVNVENRVEEGLFMQFFDEEFGLRHGPALAALANRVELDYVVIDCAETRDGKLLIFEADNCAIVHDIDPVNVFPYKGAQMRKVFDAFIALLTQKSELHTSGEF
jgi:hypothetical protein